MAYVKNLKYVELDLDGRLCEPDVNFGSRYVDEKKVPKDLKTAVNPDPDCSARPKETKSEKCEWGPSDPHLPTDHASAK